MSKFDIDLRPLDELFMNDIGRADAKKERIHDVPISELSDFPNHPFRVLKDDELMRVVQSIKESGVLIPAIAREKGGAIELISGHRRKVACEILGIETMPVLIRKMTDDEAVVAMVDSNLQREHILPSEKAFAYKMKLEALKHQGKRTDLTSSQLGTKLRSDELLAENANDSRNQIQRYIRLTYLIPELLVKVDDKQIAFNPAVEISYLSEDEQRKLLETITQEECVPSHAQAIKLKGLSQQGGLNGDEIQKIIQEPKPNQQEQYRFKKDAIRKYFPQSYTDKQVEETLFRLLEQWQRRNRDRDAR